MSLTRLLISCLYWPSWSSMVLLTFINYLHVILLFLPYICAFLIKLDKAECLIILYVLLEYVIEAFNFIYNKKTSYFDLLEPLSVVDAGKQNEALEEQKLKITPQSLSVEKIAVDTLFDTKKQSWYVYSFNQAVYTILDISGQKDSNSAQALFVKAQFKLQLDYALTELHSRNIPITEEDFCRLSTKVMKNVLFKLDLPENQTKVVGLVKKFSWVVCQESYDKVYDSVYRNKKVISGILVTGAFTFVAKDSIKSAYNFCAMRLPAPLKKAFPQIFVACIVGISLVKMYNMPPRDGDLVITPSQGMVAKTYAKTKSSSFPKDYSTLAGSKRYYSNFSFKEKLKRLKLISSKIINYISKQKFFLFIFFILLLQITFFFFLLKNVMLNYFVNMLSYFCYKYPLQDILAKSLEDFCDDLKKNYYFFWNCLTGLSAGKSLYFVFHGMFFFFRHNFRPFLWDLDNVWLPRFIEKHKGLTSQWLFLNRFNWFNSLSLLDQSLFRIILIKVWMYLFPLAINLMFLKVIYWQYFLLGLATMFYCQFFNFLVIIFCFLAYSPLIRGCNIFFLEKFPKIYENNFFNYFSILLTLHALYNLFLAIFWFTVYFLNAKLLFDKLSAIYVFLLVTFMLISILIALAEIFLGFLYFFMLLVFNINLHNLNEQELFFKKSKVFLYSCFLLCCILVYHYCKS